uniref:Uncharacterized protein n=1 Tax=Kalanchoe fedtschenkoi TaxID=63787 RepID=A0A7N0UM27_KALFE
MAAKQAVSLLAFAFSIIITVWCNVVDSRHLPSSATTMSQKHAEWMAKFGRVYTSEIEKQMRLEIFAKNAKFVDEFNAAAGNNKRFTVSINNHFADHTQEEIKQRYYGYNYNASLLQDPKFETSFKYENANNIPQSMDWREKGVLTPIKNQSPHGSKCGSCWAFASISTIESVNKLKTGELVSLSEQELLDCTDNNGGCGGGYPEYAFEYVQQHGVAAEQSYPYLAQTSTCNTKRVDSLGIVRISGFEQVPYAEGEEGLLKAVANQPAVASVKVGKEFQFYDGGIFDGGCGATLNHVVVVVGYGVADDGTKYWILRNSWGEEWGESGYMRVQRDTGNGGVCGVGTDVSYPIA